MVKSLIRGRIVKILSDDYTVLVGNQRIICKARGKFRKLEVVPMVGDMVFISSQNMIEKIDQRKNQLTRPFVANVDQAVIVVSVKEPSLSLYLLDKLLVLAEYNQIKPIICFTKLDLLTNLKEIKKIIKYYKIIGYSVFTNQDGKIKNVFKNKVTVFAGQTGAGKSSLLNYLDKSLNLKTAEISKALGRGKHTTRHVELYSVYDGLVADTPGFSALKLSDMKPSDIRDSMVEFEGCKEKCQFRDCLHKDEIGCYVKQVVLENEMFNSRYRNYLKFISEV